jgi:hypothetical protein
LKLDQGDVDPVSAEGKLDLSMQITTGKTIEG